MRRFLWVGFSMLLAVAACGDDETTADSSTSGTSSTGATSSTSGTSSNTSSNASSGTGSSSSGGMQGECGHMGDAEPAGLEGATAAHNAKRCARDPEGGDPIPPLAWDSTVAATAQAYADQLAQNGCDLVHSDSPYGENLFWGSSTYDPSYVVDAWVDGEESCYTYTTFPDTCSCTCGHLTQVLWRNSTKVGCGVANCNGGGEVWVCNYDPPGNYLNQYPY